MSGYHPMRRPEYFYKQVAENLGLDYKLVRDVNKWFWAQGVRRNMSTAAHRSIYVKYLGTITMSRKKLYAAIYRMVRKLRNIRKSERYTPEFKKTLEEAYLVQLQQLLHQRNLWARETRDR